MSKIAFCAACSAERHGVKTRVAIEHTCEKGEGNSNRLPKYTPPPPPPIPEKIAVGLPNSLPSHLLQQKAKQLFERFYFGLKTISIKEAKQCASIAVDEMIEIQKDFYGLVVTPAFRARVLARVEDLEYIKVIIENM